MDTTFKELTFELNTQPLYKDICKFRSIKGNHQQILEKWKLADDTKSKKMKFCPTMNNLYFLYIQKFCIDWTLFIYYTSTFQDLI